MKILIPGNPEPQLRPRAVRAGKGIRMYDPQKTSDYKNYVRQQAKQQCTQKPFEGALQVELDIYRQIQKSSSKKDRRLKNERIIRPTVKADIDNYSKAILDALNGIAWQDDSQVVGLIANKYYSDHPRVEVMVQQL